MKLEHAKLIVKCAAEEGEEVTLYERYSGRGFFGRTTTGVVFSSMDGLLKGTAAAAVALADTGEFSEFINAMGKFSYDNMGRDYIAY